MSGEASSSSTDLAITIKGPNDSKFSISIPAISTVLELKELIATQEGSNAVPVENQRLIYSGRVLKDEELVSKYNLKSGNTVHLVKGARAANAEGGPPAPSNVPNSFAAGNQIAGNPLAPFSNAQYAGALAGFNPFQGMNTNDPNLMQNMMNDPSTQNQIRNLLNDPAVLDQVIQSNPELRAMGPQVRQLMQSEQFRSFLSNPQAMAQMQQMRQQMQGMPGMPPSMQGMMGAAPPAAGATTAPAGGPLFNPWGSAPPVGAPGTGGMAAGGMPDFSQMQEMMNAMGMGQMGAGGFGGAPALPAGPVIPPEERYQDQLAQLADMGFHDAARNVRALLATGGNVQGAVEYLFSMP